MQKNEHHEGDLVAKAGIVYDYVSVGGYIYARGANTKTAFPRLQSVGGSIDASGDWKHVEIGNIEHCRAILLQSFAKSGYSFADNVLAKVVSTKGQVSREYCDKGYAAELKEKTKAANERREKALEDCDHA